MKVLSTKFSTRTFFVKSWLLAAVVFLTAAVGCQREVEEILEEEPPVVVEPSKGPRIVAIHYIDSIAPGVEDTIESTIYTYDSRDRLIKTYSEYNPENIYEVSLDYLANDTLPYLRRIYHLEDGETINIDSSFLFYEEGIIVKDSTVKYSTVYTGGTIAVFAGYSCERYEMSGNTVRRFTTQRSSGLSEYYDNLDVVTNFTILQDNDRVYEQVCETEEWGDNLYIKLEFTPDIKMPPLPSLPGYPIHSLSRIESRYSAAKFFTLRVYTDDSPGGGNYTQFRVEVNQEGFPVYYVATENLNPLGVARARVQYAP